MRKIDFSAMNCQMMACLDDDSLRAARRLDDVPGWFEAWEQRLSRFRPESELTYINQRNSDQVHISAVIDDVLRAARLSHRESGGLVNPLVLPVLEAVGYDRSFELIGQKGRSVLENELKDICTSAYKLHARRGLLELPLGARIDLGGVAKGWSADRAAHRLGKLAPALVDAGGDIAVSGAQTDGSPWPVGVSDPLNPGQHLDLVLLSRGGVATSGRDYRRWQTGGVEFHHIIDPRTGRPAATDVLTATVIGPSARAAEAAAKTVLILGSWRGQVWLDERPHLAGLMKLENGEVLHSRNWIDHIWSENNEPTYDYPIG